jgi:hypothetical protein
MSLLFDHGIPSQYNIRCNNEVVDGNLAVAGTFTPGSGIITPGNIVVSNAGPSISIVDNAINTNRATLLLQGGPLITPVKLQQDGSGNVILENGNASGNISLINDGSGSINLNTAVATPSNNLVLINSNPVVSSTRGAVTQTGSQSSAVTYNGSSCRITTVSLNVASGANQPFTFNNSAILANSVILVSVDNYGGSTGFPYVTVQAVTTGSCVLTIFNLLQPGPILNGTLNIAFLCV